MDQTTLEQLFSPECDPRESQSLFDAGINPAAAGPFIGAEEAIRRVGKPSRAFKHARAAGLNFGPEEALPNAAAGESEPSFDAIRRMTERTGRRRDRKYTLEPVWLFVLVPKR